MKDEKKTNLKLSEEINLLKKELREKSNLLSDLDVFLNDLPLKETIDNYQILQNIESLNSTPRKSFSDHLSNIPYLYIILNSKADLKKLRTNLKGYRTIKRKKLFDEKFYLKKYQDVLNSGMDPLIHYLYFGYMEGKNPSIDFDGNAYIDKYTDVKTSKILVMAGHEEGIITFGKTLEEAMNVILKYIL